MHICDYPSVDFDNLCISSTLLLILILTARLKAEQSLLQGLESQKILFRKYR